MKEFIAFGICRLKFPQIFGNDFSVYKQQNQCHSFYSTQNVWNLKPAS